MFYISKTFSELRGAREKKNQGHTTRISENIEANAKNLKIPSKKWFLAYDCISVNSHFHSFLTFSEVKKLHSEARKGVIEKKLLGSNRPYMSYPTKFTFYLHQAYGY